VKDGDFIGATNSKYQLVDQTVFISFIVFALYFACGTKYERWYEPETITTESGTELSMRFFGTDQSGEKGPLITAVSLLKTGPIKQNGQVHPRAVYTGLGHYDQSELGDLIHMGMWLLVVGSLVLHYHKQKLGLFLMGTNTLLTVPLVRLLGDRVGYNILFPTEGGIPLGHLNFDRTLTPEEWLPIANLHVKRENWYVFCYSAVPLACGWFNAMVIKGNLNPWTINKATKQFQRTSKAGDSPLAMRWNGRSTVLLILYLVSRL
jgi:hypothetical protein